MNDLDLNRVRIKKARCFKGISGLSTKNVDKLLKSM